ncbi:MAG: PTS lactose/cellobiose transporter subunit IIA [Candidatus Eremiobacterota bacterium]
MMDINEEQQIFQIILHSGNSRAESYTSLREGRKGNLDESGKAMEKSRDELDKAHSIHRDILSDPDKVTSCPSLLLVHAQDHLMTSMAEQALIKEMNEQMELIRKMSERIKTLEDFIEKKK